MEKDTQKSAIWTRICSVPPWRFADSEEEKLYSTYTLRQRQGAVPCLLIAGIILQAHIALVPGKANLHFAYGSISIALLANCSLLIAHFCIRRLRPILPHLTWAVLWTQLLVSEYLRISASYNELLGWATILQYFTLAVLPLHFMFIVIYSLISFFAYLTVQQFNAYAFEEWLPDDFELQQIANASILLGATFLGGTAFAMSEWQQRNSFQETKKSLRDKLAIEQQSKEQERLLLSVLPEHVAVQMRKDIGLIDTQFKKIYMSRHENVSILYADIVGFTAISSTYSAQDLVAILNELFARFDRLSEKYHQLRIKILGDCYYCISGAPIERPDHAVLCVHMGLSMVKAIKYVQQTTKSPVDMRVGIHTGAVLAGVLGQRQWQFDVYSRDVELANKMESSGMPGRVHISEVTLGFLDNDFEVEPAHGERREEMLRQAGIKTYFIVRVLKPFQGNDDKKGVENGGAGAGGDAGDAELLSELRDDDEDSVLSPQDEKKDIKDCEELKIQNMLQEELVQRDDDKELEDATTLCLTFKSVSAERAYVRRCESCPLSVVVPPAILVVAVAALAAVAVPTSTSLQALHLALVLETGVLNILYYVYFRCAQYKKKKVNPYWKFTCGAFNIAMFVASSVATLVICGAYETALEEDGLRADAPALSSARRCLHPSYYYHLGASAACGLLWVPAGGAARGAGLLVLAAAHAAPALLHPRLLLHPDFAITIYNTTTADSQLLNALSDLHTARNILMLFIIIIPILVINRYTESLERARHSRGVRMAARAAQAAELRRRNEALVCNVLPPHVASHFMGARHHHRDLYSQSYAEVGVLFASMPNFSEFYSEETVNNQGLECLRFLNEVISDFDLLLEESRYSKDIIKIKTISSTYMAASGLNPARQMQESDSVVVRWAHLACLVEFALELQRVLAAINEQSFNHFVLRLGVNHGPITAGVIGARKPHYDIWGNTVNVASRMESTGKAGCIQVTEETCEILQEFGYYFEQRGLVAVKGKGQLMTYYLQGKCDPTTENKTSAIEVPSQVPDVEAETEFHAEHPLLSISSEV